VGEYLSRLFGKPIGKAVLTILLLTGPLPVTIFNLKDLYDFTSTNILNQTPIEAIACFSVATVLFGLTLGVPTIGRAAELLFPLTVFLILVMIVSQTPAIRFDEILPIGEYGFKPIVAASLLLVGYPYLEPSVVWMIGYRMDKPEHLVRALFISAIVSAVFFFLATFVTITTSGPELGAQLSFPTYFNVKMINIGDFYQRIESLLSFIFFVMIFFRQALLFFVSASGVSELFSVRDYRHLLVPLALVLLPLSFNVWSNPGELFALVRNWVGFRLLFGVLLPLIILFVAIWKQRRAVASA
ncbi:MAG: GerAB/ArcD/ProY family transporter, partial [Cohnella sp.]|nr:GerAB/ArcD/ProY family transporter [Cohnella sp.]